jgi:catechol 2,3-dioxygenase-like lactoylglutathione lyase family enzyme
MLKISKLDHLVLTVRNIDRSAAFYELVLGMKKEYFGEGRIALKYADQKINLHKAGNEFEPKATSATPGSADLCFITETPLADAMAHVQTCGVEIIKGPVDRTGATGLIRSFYFRDPDQNLIEVANEL